MILRLLLISIFFCSFINPGSRSELIQWSSTRKLRWNDFKARPPENAGNAALTSSGILLSFGANGATFHYELSCNFDQDNSWGRVKNDYILSHEQGHFDIAEIYTRKLNKALKRYRYHSNSFNKDVNTIYQSTMKELTQMQNQYDQQTDHSRNAIQQRNWLLKISNLLEGLKTYAAYK